MFGFFLFSGGFFYSLKVPVKPRCGSKAWMMFCHIES